MNQKGDIPSLIYFAVIIFVVGVFLFFTSHLTDSIEDKFDNYFDKSTKYNNSVAHVSLNEINAIEQSAWDYAFLGIVAGMFLAMFLTAYATRISAAFFWVYGCVSVVVLMIGVVVSNAWQELAADATLSGTITRFPIMNALLGTKYPLVITAVILLTMILLFGKSPEQSGAGRFG